MEADKTYQFMIYFPLNIITEIRPCDCPQLWFIHSIAQLDQIYLSTGFWAISNFFPSWKMLLEYSDKCVLVYVYKSFSMI